MAHPMTGAGLNLVQICIDLLDFAMRGAAAMPLLMALGLTFGRRGNAKFCLAATSALGALAFWLSFTGPLYFLSAYLEQIGSLAAPGAASRAEAFFSPAAFNYSLSLGVWALGQAALYMGLRLLLKADPAMFAARGDSYELKIFKSALFFLFLSLFCYFLTFITAHWPFAGFPEGITRERAIMAILRNAARSWFMALSPAGAMACVYAVRRGADLIPKNSGAARRWCAFWAFAGYLPSSLQHLGLLLGASAGAYRNFAAGYLAQLTSVSLVLGGLICFAFALVKAKAPGWLAYLGLILYLCARAAPKIIFQQMYSL